MQKSFGRIYFAVFGLLDLIALVTALLYSLSVIADYFSYFTVLSNILITIVFLSFGVFGIKKANKSRFIQESYLPAVLYMSITGIVFWTILKGGNHHLTILPWISMILHGITPIAAFVGFILFPPLKKVSYVKVWKWLLPPLAFVIYTLIRGLFIHWYPYTILNPETAGGYRGVMGYVAGILIGAYLVGVVLVYISNYRFKSKKTS